MPIHRRDFIRLVGGGAVFAAMPAASCTGLPDPHAAWVDPGAQETDPRRRALSWAILAPNPHNMQPWMADLREAGAITLYVDPTRLLPQTDPFNRQIVIGCGAFLELLRMAAAKDGYDARIESFPQGEPWPRLDLRPVARVTFANGGAPDPLFAHALERRTTRVPFDDRAVAPAQAARIAAAGPPGVNAAFTLDPSQVADLRRLVFQGEYVEAHTPATHRESVERTFIGGAAIAEHPYGISLSGPAMEALHATGLFTRARMQTPGTWAFNETLRFMQSLADTARGFVWLTTATNTRADQLAAGRAYLRINTQAAAEGLAMHPWSQVLQEYPAMAPLFREVHQRLAPGGERVQMLVRIGYAKPVPPAPRRGLAAQIRSPA